MLSRLVDIRFQILFTPLAGVLFTFPSRYLFTIGRQVVCSLGRWSSRIPTGFLGPRGTQEPDRETRQFRLQGCHPLWHAFPGVSAISVFDNSPERLCSSMLALQPPTYNATELAYVRFRLIRVRSPLLAGSLLMSFPEGTEMFHFPSLASAGLCIQPADTLT